MDKPRLPGFTGASSLYRHGHYPGITQSPAETLVLPQFCYTNEGGRTTCCECASYGGLSWCTCFSPRIGYLQ